MPGSSSAARFAALLFFCLTAVPAGARADEQVRPATSAPSATPAPSPTPAPPLQWRSIGPGVTGGRMATIAGTDLDPALIYAGAAGGGVWKSTNGGAGWQPVFDTAGSLSIGAIAINPHDASDVWVGTGESWVRNDVIPGDGIYHSTDGGKSWTRSGLEQTSQIARVLIDPRDPHTLIVAALGDPFRDNPERGIFRSTDGGKTWEKTLYAGPSVGASDVAMDPKNPDVLLAGLWRFRRSAWNLASGGDDDGIYRSTDGGKTWARLRGNGLPDGPTGRIGLAFAPGNAKRVYALIESPAGILWRSDDGGETWAKTSSNTLINERPFYYSRIVVDPHDDDHLFSVSVRLAESTNGGKTWHVSGKRVHGDHHDLWISANGRTVLDANDGGVAISRDSGATWRWQNTIPVSQFYRVAAGAGDPYRICGGLQDNGSWCGVSRTGDERGIMAIDWLGIGGGDGTWVVPAPDGRYIYTSSGGGDNQGETERYDAQTRTTSDVSPYLRNQNVVAPRQLKYRFNWETPLAFLPQDPSVLYIGGNVLFRSTDRGMHWTPISPDLTRNLKERQGLTGGIRLDVTGAEAFDTILAIAPSTLERGTIWVSTDDGLVQLTRDEGRHWIKTPIPGVDADGRIPSIEASRARAATAYVAVDRHYVGDRTPYVYVTDDRGRSWRAIVRGLPHAEVHVVREDPVNPRVLYVGTGKGVWWSEDRGADWKPFPAQLPMVEVRDLTVSGTGDLIAATHGRGMYVFDDLTPLREHAAVARTAAVLFAPRTAQPLHRTTPTVGAIEGADPPPAILTFWQREPAKTEPALIVRDAHGTVVRRIEGAHLDDDGNPIPNVANLAGFNRLGWQLDRQPPTLWRRIAPWDRGPDGGPPLPSGTYTVQLVRGGHVVQQTLHVLRDPSVASAQDEAAGDRFAVALFAELSALDDALNGLDNIRLQLTAQLPSMQDAALAQRAHAALDEAQRIESSISSQPVNDQDNDFLTDLLRERVLSLIYTLSPGAPTGPMRAEADVLHREGDAALRRYRTFVGAQVRPLDAALRAAKLGGINLQALPAPVKHDPDADEHARRGEDD